MKIIGLLIIILVFFYACSEENFDLTISPDEQRIDTIYNNPLGVERGELILSLSGFQRVDTVSVYGLYCKDENEVDYNLIVSNYLDFILHGDEPENSDYFIAIENSLTSLTGPGQETLNLYLKILHDGENITATSVIDNVFMSDPTLEFEIHFDSLTNKRGMQAAFISDLIFSDGTYLDDNVGLFRIDKLSQIICNQ